MFVSPNFFVESLQQGDSRSRVIVVITVLIIVLVVHCHSLT
jgi:hypothetical protein